jgi:hypothetical protein
MWKALGGFSANIGRFQHILPLLTAQINCSGSGLTFIRRSDLNHKNWSFSLMRRCRVDFPSIGSEQALQKCSDGFRYVICLDSWIFFDLKTH